MTRSAATAVAIAALSLPHHRAILVSPSLRDVGVAAAIYRVADDGRMAATYVLDFGRRSG